MKLVPGCDSTPLNAAEYEEYAREYLDKNAFDYFASGADEMVSLRANRSAFAKILLRPRVLRDLAKLDLKTSILGKSIEFPICIAPTAMQCMANALGEKAVASAAAKAGSCMILSTLSTTSLEDVAQASGNGLRWFQLYVFRDREITRSLVERAERAGFKAIVLTVDTPCLGHREPDVRNRFSLPKHLQLANFATIGGQFAHGVQAKMDSGLAEYVKSLFDLSLNWDDVKWLQSITKLPVVVKGILTAEDAEIAVQMGCAGIIVSNHGARQLDGVPATIDALVEVVEAVRGRVEVFMDGGIRRGTDVFKALAIGARAVFVGRPILWALCHSGESGVHHLLQTLREELHHAMLFSGTAKISDISPAYLGRTQKLQSFM